MKGAALLAGFLAAPLSASTILAPAGGTTLEAGATVRVEWTGGDSGADEQELLISLDGGAHFSRLTRDLRPEQRVYFWRVPNLPAAGVVLAVRQGEESFEDVVAVSGPLEIAGNPGEPLPSFQLFKGEILVTDAMQADLPAGAWAGERDFESASIPGAVEVSNSPRQDAAPSTVPRPCSRSGSFDRTLAFDLSQAFTPAHFFPRRN